MVHLLYLHPWILSCGLLSSLHLEGLLSGLLELSGATLPKLPTFSPGHLSQL